MGGAKVAKTAKTKLTLFNIEENVDVTLQYNKKQVKNPREIFNGFLGHQIYPLSTSPSVSHLECLSAQLRIDYRLLEHPPLHLKPFSGSYETSSDSKLNLKEFQ